MSETSALKINDNCTLHINGNSFKMGHFLTSPLIVDEFKITEKEELPMTERQIEIKEKIDGCEKAIEKLKEEYEQEGINAVAERDAYARYAKYSAFIKAGFSEEQAFAMLNKD